jgi:hypothetical protein
MWSQKCKKWEMPVLLQCILNVMNEFISSDIQRNIQQDHKKNPTQKSNSPQIMLTTSLCYVHCIRNFSSCFAYFYFQLMKKIKTRLTNLNWVEERKSRKNVCSESKNICNKCDYRVRKIERPAMRKLKLRPNSSPMKASSYTV